MVPEIKLAYYRINDWEKLMNSIADRESMHDTWVEWHREFTRTKESLKAIGFTVHEITINIDALNKHCKDLGLPNNGATRSKYVSQLPIKKKR